jgi:autotransporter-associated beta strand protein
MKTLNSYSPKPLFILGLLMFLTVRYAGATNLYFDLNGVTAGSGVTNGGSYSWEASVWSTDSTGSSATAPWTEGNFPEFAAGTDGATASYTVTAGSPHHIVGALQRTSTGTVTLNGGDLTIDGGAQQGFFSSGFLTINNKLTGTGGIISQSGQLFLNGNNDYSGGTTPGSGLINFNNANSFGTGPILMSSSGGALIAEGTSAINIPNSWTISLATATINCVGNTAGITYSGNVSLGTNTFNIGCGGSTANIDIFSGVISGTGNIGRSVGQNPAGIIKFTGANTYTGKTTLQSGITYANSLNSVTTPAQQASSSFGKPSSAANGTISIGATTFAATLVYVGVGETTDRVIDLGGTTAGATIENDGTGPLIFTSAMTASGAGAKTLTLQGANTGNNTISAKIVNSSSATSVTKAQAGTWTLAGANTYTGNTTLNAGLLNLANASALGTGVFTIGGNGSFDNTSGADLTIANAITCSGGSPTYVGSANNVTINGAALITGANRTITVSARTLTLGSALGDSGQARAFTKGGSGTLVLAAGSTYTGNTTISGGTLTIGGAGQMTAGSYSGTISDSGTFNYASSAAQTLSGVISGSGAVSKNGSGTLTLTAAETYTGNTTVNVGLLALTGNGSLANGSSVNIAAGATLDVSGRSSATYTLGTGATLTASGSGTSVGSTASTIVGASGGIVSLGSRPVSLTFTPTAFNGDSTHPSLYVSQGALSLNGNAFTINNASGTPLDVGTYVLIQQASGNVTSAGVYSTTVTGSGVTAGNAGYISVSGGNVNLIVAPAVSFSGLTASQSISYGGANILLAGTVSGAGPSYPAQGEPITVIINGNAQSTTINDATGDFSFSYNSSTIPASATAYAITYFYPGNGTTMSAAADSSTTLTVAKAPVSVTANNQTKTYGQTATFGSGGTQFTPSGLQNGETIGSVTLTCSGGVATAPISGSPYTITPSAAAGGTFSPNNYTITYNTGTLTVNPATLTVTAAGLLVYGSDATNAQYLPQYATLQGTDTLGVISGSANFSTDATATNYAGSNYIAHVVDTGTLSAANYIFVVGPDGVMTITNRPLTVTNVVADKVYDGTTAAPLDFTNVGVNGLVNGDDASITLITTNATGLFANKNAGAGKTVVVSGLFTVGDLGTNYILIQPTLTANISQLAVTVTAATDTKVYDRTNSSASLPIPSPGVAPGDTANFSQTFDNRNAGTGKTLTPSGSVSDGNGGANYTLTLVSSSTGEIDPRPITVTAAADTKGYDGTTASAGVPGVGPAIIPGDTTAFTQSYATKHAGVGKTLIPTGSVNDGNGGANYSISFVNDTTGVITPKPITVTALANTKVYDGNVSAVAAPTVAPAVLPGDTANFSETYDTKDIGTGKTLTPGGAVSDGNGGANYSVTFANDTSGVITAKQLTVLGVEADDKVYDGATNAMLVTSNAVLAGVIAPDDVTLATTNALGAFADKNVGTNKAVQISGLAIYGADSGDYLLVQPVTNASISQLAVTVTAAADTKVYDGTTNSAGVPLASPAIAAGDTANFSQTFDTRNAGTGKTLTPSGSVNDGNGGANYSLTFVSSATGEIDPDPVTVTAATDTKVYDGTTASAGVPIITPGLVSGDVANFTQSFNTKNAGIGKTLIPTGSVTDGNGGANYSVTFASDTTGVITAKPVTVTAVAATKVYDGTTSSTGVPTISPGVAPGDAPNFSETYDTKDAGTGKTLTPAGSVADGNAGANYNVTFANNTSGVITQVASATALLSSVNPSGPGTNVTFTATVNGTPPAADLPTGDVVFSANGTPFATNALVSGSASASTASLPLGTNAVTAEYLGDINFLGSTGAVAQVVQNFIVYSTTNVLLGIVNNNDGTFTLNLQGTPGAQYYVLGSSDVSLPIGSWTVVSGGTNTAPDPSGLWSLVVSNPAPAFYRSAAVNPAP